MMILARVAADAGGVALAEAVTLAEAKRHLNVLHSGDDVYISSLARAVQAHLEGADGSGGLLGRPVVPHTFDGTLEAFPLVGYIALPCPPVVSVAHVKYFDEDGVEQTLDPSKYKVQKVHLGGRIVLKDGLDWPDTAVIPDAVTIRFSCGPASPPEDLKQAMLLWIGHLFTTRGYAEGQQPQMPQAVDWLIGQHKTHGWI